jgi:hypothetical protein
VEVVLRPVNDRFLEVVVFPAMELGVVDAVPAIEHMLQHIDDEQAEVALEMLLDRGIEGSFFGLEDDKWSSAIYRLLFNEWEPHKKGWRVTDNLNAYAGDWEGTLHLALMLEDEAYPYADEPKANWYRHNFYSSPFAEQGLSALVCGTWDPPPGFPPDQVLTVAGRGDFRPQEGIARADWSWRSLDVVNLWGAQLPNTLSRLLEKESRRLKPIEPPEKHEVLAYWLGRVPEPPTLAVSFSGLGEKSNLWIREIGMLARTIRDAAAKQHGLTAIISHRGESDYHIG